MKEYFDIIDQNHYELRYHPRMSLENRAAQFAPFDALVGYKEEIWEKGRLTEKRKILSEEEVDFLNSKLNSLQKKDLVLISYFVPDSTKNGGRDTHYEGIIKEILSVEKKIVFQDQKRIFFELITCGFKSGDFNHIFKGRETFIVFDSD